jgi:hypothetical protein
MLVVFLFSEWGCNGSTSLVRHNARKLVALCCTLLSIEHSCCNSRGASSVDDVFDFVDFVGIVDTWRMASALLTMANLIAWPP